MPLVPLCGKPQNSHAQIPGEMPTMMPRKEIKHKQKLAHDAVVSEFSTRSVDKKDIFTDREIQRITRIV